jgi:hypothetical protein
MSRRLAGFHSSMNAVVRNICPWLAVSQFTEFQGLLYLEDRWSMFL